MRCIQLSDKKRAKNAVCVGKNMHRIWTFVTAPSASHAGGIGLRRTEVRRTLHRIPAEQELLKIELKTQKRKLRKGD